MHALESDQIAGLFNPDDIQQHVGLAAVANTSHGNRRERSFGHAGAAHVDRAARARRTQRQQQEERELQRRQGAAADSAGVDYLALDTNGDGVVTAGSVALTEVFTEVFPTTIDGQVCEPHPTGGRGFPRVGVLLARICMSSQY